MLSRIPLRHKMAKNKYQNFYQCKKVTGLSYNLDLESGKKKASKKFSVFRRFTNEALFHDSSHTSDSMLSAGSDSSAVRAAPFLSTVMGPFPFSLVLTKLSIAL